MNHRNSRRSDLVLNKLLDKIGCEFEPEIIPVQAESYAQLHNCFLNVEEKVKQDGGQVHYGWAIHETNLLREAERHAVWENPEGELTDVTPHEPEVNEILFVSDNNWVYSGARVDNIRVNRTNNPVVDDFIYLCEFVSTILSYGSRGEGWNIILPPLATAAYEIYNPWKEGVHEFIYRGGRPHTSCPCGSSKPYRSCHGSQLRERIKEDLTTLRTVLGTPT